MNTHHLRHVLNWDACEECGDCLIHCRYMDISRPNAVEAIKNCNQGKPSGILKNCISCYAYNIFCPNNAHPCERILFGMKERYDEHGPPKRADYNIFTNVLLSSSALQLI